MQFTWILIIGSLLSVPLYADTVSDGLPVLLRMRLASSDDSFSTYHHDHTKLVQELIAKTNETTDTLPDANRRTALLTHLLSQSFNAPSTLITPDTLTINGAPLSDGGSFFKGLRQSVLDKTYRNAVNLSRSAFTYPEWKQARPNSSKYTRPKALDKAIVTYNKKLKDIYLRGRKDLATALATMAAKIIEAAPAEIKTDEPTSRPLPKTKPKPPLNLHHSLASFANSLEATLTAGLKGGLYREDQINGARSVLSTLHAFEWILKNAKLDASVVALLQYKVLQMLFTDLEYKVAVKIPLPRAKGKKQIYEIRHLQLKNSLEYLKQSSDLRVWNKQKDSYELPITDHYADLLRACKTLNQTSAADTGIDDVESCLNEAEELWDGKAFSAHLIDRQHTASQPALQSALNQVYQNCGINNPQALAKRLVEQGFPDYEFVELATAEAARQQIPTTTPQQTLYQNVPDLSRLFESVGVVNQAALRIASIEAQENAFIVNQSHGAELSSILSRRATGVALRLVQALIQTKTYFYLFSVAPLSCLYQQIEFGKFHPAEYPYLKATNEKSVYANALVALASSDLLKTQFIQYVLHRKFLAMQNGLEKSTFVKQYRDALKGGDHQFFAQQLLRHEYTFEWKLVIANDGRMSARLPNEATDQVDLSIEPLWTDSDLLGNLYLKAGVENVSLDRALESLLNTRILIEENHRP